ncbi:MULTISPECIES: MlaC/ttg2D family ABC transporter substrate-binding protein [unclassified Campylobacter]|uniref:MlaC/ttg2D family ABC transporter substrate-binding protein n=1 Tax=unclassified Campylobacter TaxID=2593542 RepID=UPI0014761B11|nr:ABC transporter substrate-binding protein [Campylobacter sp. RM9328]MBE3021981.1 ABC transporter substrate-binding protein [Campylobacter sp. 7477a]
MKFYKILLGICLFLNSAFGINENEIKDEVIKKTNLAIEVLKNSELDNETKSKELFKIFDPLFDYKQMAKISLAKRYNSLSKEEQEKFNIAFEQKLKNSYIDKLLSYTNQEVIIQDATRPQPTRYWLNSQLISDGKTYDFVYKFYDAKERGWLIYDLDIIGVSVIQTYRSQFGDMLDNADFETLLTKLNQANLPSQDDK